MKKVFFLVLISLKAYAITAISPSYIDVLNAYNSATNGESLFIPAGNGYWTNTLTIAKNIRLIGAGVNATFIYDEFSSAFGPIYIAPTNTTYLTEIANINWNTGVTNTSGGHLNGYFDLDTPYSQIRVHNNEFHLSGASLRSFGLNDTSATGTNGGCLFDKNSVYLDQCSGVFIQAVVNGSIGMSTDSPYGTVWMQWCFESNFFTNTLSRSSIDGRAGQHVLFRYNTCYNSAFETHEMDGGSKRGIRSYEVYGNNFTTTTFVAFGMLLRSGTGLIYNNSFNGPFAQAVSLVYYRGTDPFPPFGQANGTNVYDINDPTIYAAGIHTGTNNSPILQDNTVSWTANQWVGYTIINTTSNTSGLGRSSGNTNIILVSVLNTNSIPFWNTGDGYRILRVDRGFDMPGLGKGSILTGVSDTIPPTPQAWPNQVDDPIRFYNNTGVGGIDNAAGIFAMIVNGRNYTNTPLPGYIPLQFPHPLDIDGVGNGLNINLLRVNNIISGQ